MKYRLLALFIFFICKAIAQTDSINQRIFLIGDAGEMPGKTHPVIAWLKKNADWEDEKNTVMYLGDNVYPLGMPLKGDPTYAEAKRILDDQISLVKGKKGRAIFIPGNHDWRNGKLGGWQQVMNEVDYINSLGEKNIQSWPLYGCPGPVQVELSDKVVVALFDSEWFLYLHDKPGPGSNCSSKTIDEFQTELQEIANTHPNQVLIIAMHHPIYSYGIHGGDYPLKEHIFPFTALNPKLYIPLPVIGSIYPLTRGVFGSIQDVAHPLYKNMSGTVLEVIRKHPNTIVVSGHDHGLQLIKRDSVPYIISGAGSVLSRTKPGKYSVFSDVEYGFSMIEVWKSGKVDVKFYNLSSADLNTPTFTSQLKTLLPPPAPVLDTTRIILDSVVRVAASPKLRGNPISRFLLGKNYRKEWTQPVRVPVLDMGKELGGLTLLKQGGTKQTKSLLVQDTSGKTYTLRSVIRYPSGTIPSDLRESVLKDDLIEGISASYPYGSLSMAVLSHAAGIPYLQEKLVYLPDDPRLTRFRGLFKNSLAIMEENVPKDVKKSDNTDELVLKMAKNNDDHVDQLAVLQARLLDNFVMDFDRHEDQWQWATIDTGRGKIFYPIPQDRDQAFFVNEGLVPRFSRKPWLVPELQGFSAKAHNIKTFNRAARQFDRTFMTALSADDWSRQIDMFLKAMTDSVIETALLQQPQEIHDKNMQKIMRTLKKRRKYFKSEMMDYYRFISKTVSVVGTNQREQFTVTKNDNGSVRVVVNKIRRKDSTLSSVIYDRVFYPGVTKQLRLFGLGDDDRFIVEGGNSPIKILIIGGSGNDEFINHGTGGKVAAYDVSFEKNEFSGNKGIKNRVSTDPQMNVYDRLNYKYNFLNPSLGFAYNVDDGLFIGPKFEYIKQGFHKEPYAARQFFFAERAIKTGSYHFVYDGDFIKVIGRNDLVVRSDLRAPDNVTNFFGIGNNTVKDDNLPNFRQFYRARYNIMNATIYVRRQLQSYLRVNLGPTFQSLTVDSIENQGRYVSEQGNGLNHVGMFNNKQYGGADLRMDINSKNNDMVPTRGLVLDLGIRSLMGLNKESHNLTQVNADMRIYMSLATQKKLVLATRFGWAKNYGAYELPQAQYLGGTDNLRGYLKQRFAGRSVLYNNTELRIKFFDFNTYMFPGFAGVQVFNDIGRVYADNEHSNHWHDGYGFGIWIAPIQRFVVTASLAHSEEETILPRLTFGFEF